MTHLAFLHGPWAVAASLLGLLLMVGLALALLGTEAQQADMTSRIDVVIRRQVQVKRQLGVASKGTNLLRVLGEVVRGTTLISARSMTDLEATVQAAGMNPNRFVTAFIGAKALMLVMVPLGAWIYASVAGFELTYKLLAVFGGVVGGLMLPNFVLGFFSRPYSRQLRAGLPDALDLMVVCAEAGLGLETTVDRVASEMKPTNRPISSEFAVLAQELRLMPDRGVALERMGQRTGQEGFIRLGGTLRQTLRFGTPLSQSLRVLAAEMRTERMIRFEEKAAKLPAMLVLPLILFIMPSLFIVLIGPSIIKIMANI